MCTVQGTRSRDIHLPPSFHWFPAETPQGPGSAQGKCSSFLGKVQTGPSSSGLSPGTKYESLRNSAIPWPQCEWYPSGKAGTCTRCDTVGKTPGKDSVLTPPASSGITCGKFYIRFARTVRPTLAR